MSLWPTKDRSPNEISTFINLFSRPARPDEYTVDFYRPGTTCSDSNLRMLSILHMEVVAYRQEWLDTAGRYNFLCCPPPIPTLESRYIIYYKYRGLELHFVPKV